MTLERFATCTTLTPVFELETSRMTGGRRWQSLIRWPASLSAALLLGMPALWWAQRASRFENKSGSIADVRPGNVSDASADLGRLVAEVTHVSSSAIWQNPNGSYAIASHVRSGQTLTIERGQIELTYSSGAKLQLTGPAEFLIQPAGGKLRRGELVARVPEAGHGFTIETPHGKVVDLGTEFGVVVDDFGVSQVSVFEGKVETFPTGTVRSSRDKIELTSGRAIQWTDESVTPISLQGSRYHRLSNDLLANETAGLTKTAIDDDFRGKPLGKERWKTLGEVFPTEHGLRLGGVARQRPYLLTAQEFDPSYGAITVVCDLRFENIDDAENTSSRFLPAAPTNAANPTLPGRICSPDRLAVGSRPIRFPVRECWSWYEYEADRELTNISWGGFSRPQTDTLYRLAMRDDGLNVTFTVSLAGNQLVRKNITCRSLFRGNQNFIAFEGPGAGTVVIERLMISQDGASVEDAAPLASDAASEFVAPELQGTITRGKCLN